MKIFRKIFLIIILAILLIFVFKDLLFKAIIIGYIEKTFNGNCAIKRASISLKKIRLDNLKFSNKDVSFLLEEAAARLDISFNKIIRGSAGSAIENIEVSNCSIHYNAFRIDNLSVKNTGTDLYTLRISRLGIKDKEIKDIFIPLQLEKDKIVFKEARNVLFGENAYVSGFLTFDAPELIYPRTKDFGVGICLDLSLDKASFENLLAMISDGITLEGLFTGRTVIHWKNRKISKIEGDFCNTEGGFINIKKQLPLNLQKHLDISSRAALIDSFKNYAYNEGIIRINKTKNDLLLSLRFDSERMGKRNITINFHDILGGEGQ